MSTRESVHILTTREHPLAAELVSALGANNVLQDDAQIAPYRRDRSPYPEIDPGVVVTPGSVDEISKVLQIANNSRSPVVVRGGGFSMTGFLPQPPGQAIVLDTRRLNRVLDIDEENMTVTAEAGVMMSELDARVSACGFDVQTVGVPIQHTTLGGVLSGVVGGGLPGDVSVSGLTGRQVVGFGVVLPDGTLLQTNAGGANVHRAASSLPGGDGPFLTGVFIGDGGSLGVKVEATLQITPAAPHDATGQWLFGDLDSVWRALGTLAAIRETPYAGIGVAEGLPWALNFTVRASNPELLASRVRGIEHVLESCGGRPDRSGASAVPSRDWFVNADRAVVAFIFGRAQFLEAYQRIRAMLDETMRERRLADLGIGVKIYIYSHTRHAIYTSISILFERSVPGSQAQAVSLATETYELVVALGGYPEPHQGVASQIIARAWSPAYRRIFLGLKSALDPNNILNPGLWGAD
jgi:FAD/FMN-containing dehydrogenase